MLHVLQSHGFNRSGTVPPEDKDFERSRKWSRSGWWAISGRKCAQSGKVKVEGGQ